MKDIVFIDASIFIREKYFSRSNRINNLLQLHHSGLLDFVSTEITIAELTKHFIETVEQDYNYIIKSDAELAQKGIKCPLNINTSFDIRKCAKNVIDHFLQQSATHVIGYNELKSIEPIFSNYFNQNPPFHTGKKKYEFPDAFALCLLESYCQNKKLPKIIVLSADNDMKDYDSKYLDYRDYKEYVTEKSAEKNTIEAIAHLLELEEVSIVSDIEDELMEALQNETVYYNVISSSEIKEIDVKGIDVELDTGGFSIIDQTEEYYILEVPVRISYSVDIEYIEYSHAFYDREDNQWYNEEDSFGTVSNNSKLTILLKYYKPNDKIEQPYIVKDDYDVEEALGGMEQVI